MKFAKFEKKILITLHNITDSQKTTRSNSIKMTDSQKSQLDQTR
jgi:hypothetical protein